MAKTLEEVTEAALKLPAEDRAALSEMLEESLLSDEERSIREEWLDLAERRLDEIHAGKVELIPVEDSIARARAAVANARTTARRR
jgi:putative addiction module component (TIGR02574 family)